MQRKHEAHNYLDDDPLPRVGHFGGRAWRETGGASCGQTRDASRRVERVEHARVSRLAISVALWLHYLHLPSHSHLGTRRPHLLNWPRLAALCHAKDILVRSISSITSYFDLSMFSTLEADIRPGSGLGMFELGMSFNWKHTGMARS